MISFYVITSGLEDVSQDLSSADINTNEHDEKKAEGNSNDLEEKESSSSRAVCFPEAHVVDHKLKSSDEKSGIDRSELDWGEGATETWD